MKAKGRMISSTDEESGLHRSQASYNNDFEAPNGLLSLTALGLTRSTPFGRSNADPVRTFASVSIELSITVGINYFRAPSC